MRTGTRSILIYTIFAFLVFSIWGCNGKGQESSNPLLPDGMQDDPSGWFNGSDAEYPTSDEIPVEEIFSFGDQGGFEQSGEGFPIQDDGYIPVDDEIFRVAAVNIDSEPNSTPASTSCPTCGSLKRPLRVRAQPIRRPGVRRRT